MNVNIDVCLTSSYSESVLGTINMDADWELLYGPRDVDKERIIKELVQEGPNKDGGIKKMFPKARRVVVLPNGVRDGQQKLILVVLGE